MHLDSRNLQNAIEFVRSIGINVSEEAGASGFLPGVQIRAGALIVDLDTCCVSNFLHEAGHLAIVPSQYRSWMDGDVSEGQRAMLDDVATIIQSTGDVDGFLYRSTIQTSDPEATAWAWAVGMHLEFSGCQIIADTEYDGTGRTIRLQLSSCAYLGINGLAHAGFCAVNKYHAQAMGLSLYPRLERWTQL